jgi:hypothetical protein
VEGAVAEGAEADGVAAGLVAGGRLAGGRMVEGWAVRGGERTGQGVGEAIQGMKMMPLKLCVVSDHCPLILGLSVRLNGKKRFHFESFWTQLDGFQEVVSDS